MIQIVRVILIKSHVDFVTLGTILKMEIVLAVV